MMLGWRMALAARAPSVEEPVYERLVLGELALEHLDCNLAIDHRVLGDIHRTHAALTEKRLHLVVVDARADKLARATCEVASGGPAMCAPSALPDRHKHVLMSIATGATATERCQRLTCLRARVACEAPR